MSQATAKDILKWEARCRLLACGALGVPANEVLIAHVCTLSANIKARQADFDALTEGYRNQIERMTSQAEGKGDCPPLAWPLYDYFWV
jgi:hypothetical protein